MGDVAERLLPELRLRLIGARKENVREFMRTFMEAYPSVTWTFITPTIASVMSLMHVSNTITIFDNKYGIVTDVQSGWLHYGELDA